MPGARTAGCRVASDPDNQTTAPLLVDRREAGRLLGVSPGTIDNLRLRGELPSVKLLGRRLYEVADLRRLIELTKQAPETA
jgi:hypothetical protein